MYSYTCPACYTRLSFHKRVTMRRRYCPHCNHPITVVEIDRQLQEAENARRLREMSWWRQPPEDGDDNEGRKQTWRLILLVVIGSLLVALLIACLGTMGGGAGKGKPAAGKRGR